MSAFYQLCFSPTGGVQQATDAFCAGWPGVWHLIDLCDVQYDPAALSLSAEDVCVVAVPAYGGRVPAIAADRLRAFVGGGAHAILLCAYGNRAFEDTLLELYDLLTAAGFRCTAAVAAIAEHSIVRSVAAGRPDAADRQTLAAFAQTLYTHYTAGTLPDTVSLPGNRPYRDFGGVPLTPKGDRTCTACGLCAKDCPTQAIDPATPRKTDASRCISCMRCVARCPQQARTVNALALAAVTKKLQAICSEPKQNELFWDHV